MRRIIASAIITAALLCCSGCKLEEIALQLVNDGEAVSSQQSVDVNSQVSSAEGEDVQDSEQTEADTTSESDTESTAESTAESTTESAAESAVESTVESTAEDIDPSKLYTYEGVTILLPDDYKIQNEESATVYAVPNDYPAKAENIVFGKVDGKVSKITVDEVNKTYPETFEDFSGISGIDEYQINGYDVQKFSYTMAMEGVTMRQTQVICYLKNKTIIVNFTEAASSAKNEGHERAINSINIL